MIYSTVCLSCHVQELCTAFETKEETYKCLMQKGLQMLARCPETVETNVEHDINNLKEKWESVETKLSERKVCYTVTMAKCSETC